MNEYFKKTIKTIERSLNSLDDSVFERLISDCFLTINNNGKIIASGLGKNVPICEKFVGTMTSLGLSSCFLHTNTAMHGDLGYVTKKDLLIVLTKSGNTEESVALVKYANKNKKCTIWLLTFGNNTEVEKNTKNVLRLKLDSEGDDWNIVPNNSSSIFLIVLQGIALELAKRKKVSLADFRINHPGGDIGKKLE